MSKRLVHRRVGGIAVAVTRQVKVGLATRNSATASGDQAITGVGFQPTDIEIICHVGTAGMNSEGFSDGTTERGRFTTGAAATTFDIDSKIINMRVDGTNIATGIIGSFDSDGFTITWVKSNSPTGTAQILYRATKS